MSGFHFSAQTNRFLLIDATSVPLSQGHGKVNQYISPDPYSLCAKYLRFSSNGLDMRGRVVAEADTETNWKHKVTPDRDDLIRLLATCTWLIKYSMYLMPSKYCEYLNLYLQIWNALVLDSSTSESTWPQPWRTPGEEAGCWWPTPSQGSVPFPIEFRPGCCVILEDELALAWCPSDHKTWGVESSDGSVWTIWSCLPCWCMTQPWHCQTSGALPELRQEPSYIKGHCLHL